MPCSRSHVLSRCLRIDRKTPDRTDHQVKSIYGFGIDLHRRVKIGLGWLAWGFTYTDGGEWASHVKRWSGSNVVRQFQRCCLGESGHTLKEPDNTVAFEDFQRIFDEALAD